MSEQTNPADIDLGVASQSIEDRMAAFVNNDKALSGPEQADPPQDAAQQDAPQDPATDEPTADDLPEEGVEPQSAGETVFEIVHNGQTHKIASREEQVRYMQQGFDYTQKTQVLAAERAAVQANIQRSQEMVNLAPLVAQDLATVKALESQLKQFQNVDWVGLATNEPLDYPKYRAQYDQLVGAYQGAVQNFQNNATALQRHQATLSENSLYTEASKLPQIVPEWSNQERYQKEAPEMARFLISRGIPAESIDMLGRNPGDAVLVSIARDAWLYNRLKADKAGKVKQLRTVPPAPKPGASTSATAEGALKARDVHKKVGTRESAASLLLTRMKG